ncbi:UDP-glucose 6-dehydrogenase [Pararhodobacter marinus]
MRIAVIGLGVVAISDALVLARQHEVVLTGPLPDRVDAINAGALPISDPTVADYVAQNALSLRATLDFDEALKGAGMVLISTPLPKDPERHGYRTAELDSRIEMAHERCPGVPIVIRSAVPIGYTEALRSRLKSRSILYAPEFMREGQSLQDALSPAQIVIGDRGSLGEKVAEVFLNAALNPRIPVRRIGTAEAEAVKHFSQAYLATRVAYFNDLDSYAMTHGVDARKVIEGLCLDPRIGEGANNPCFGFGGQRLARSTAHLSEDFAALPARILPSLARANEARLDLLTRAVLDRGAERLGIFRPGDAGSDGDALGGLEARLRGAGITVTHYTGAGEDEDFVRFKADCDLVIAQRMSPALADIREKVFCRDLFAA